MALNTSSAYKQMMQGRLIESRIVVNITSDMESVTLVDKDVVSNSLVANWRSANNKDFAFGACYASSLSLSAFKNVSTRIEGSSIRIVPTLYYTISGGEEAIPLGEYYCSEPTVYAKTTAYTCYDAMLNFDAPITSRFTGTPYNVVSMICATCGVTLGTTSLQMSRYQNSNQIVVIDPEDINTYRDALSLVAKIMCCYCIIGRDGYLYLRQFPTSAGATLGRNRKINTSFAGYLTTFSGVKCRFKAEQNYYPYELIMRQEGVVMDLGDIPIIEDTEAAKHAILAQIWTYLENLEYFPCSIDMVGDPSIEAGDMLATPDREGYSKNVLLTSVTFKWRSSCSIQSEGSNPKAKNVSTAQKRAQQRSEQQAKNATVVTATYINSAVLNVDGTAQTEVTNLRFMTNKDLTAIFGAEIPVYSSGDGYVELSYYDSGIEGDVVKARVHEGYNLLTLVNHLYYDANRVVLLQLKAKTEAIGSGTAPVLSIDRNTIRSYVFAQGIETEAAWDGIISISEEIDYVDARLAMYGITDGVTVTMFNPIDDTLSEVVAAHTSLLNVIGLSDTVNVSLEYGDQILRCGQGHRAGAGRMLAPLVI